MALVLGAMVASAAQGAAVDAAFPRPLSEYASAQSPDLIATLRGRARLEPFNVVATVVFVLAVLHTFMAA